jgi:serine/threonine-protein kinase
MSPEQAKARPADKRSDIWAFGCVLFEMLTGRRPFDGEDVSTTLATVLMKEPAWDLLPRDTPAAAVRLLRRCLQKDARRRLDSAIALRLDIDDALTMPSGETSAPAPRKSPGLAWAALTGALVVGSALLTFALSGRTAREDGTPRIPRQFAIAPPPGVSLADDVRQPVALSADGRVLVIKGVANGGARFYARHLDQPEFVPVPGSERAASGELGSVSSFRTAAGSDFTTSRTEASASCRLQVGRRAGSFASMFRQAKPASWELHGEAAT